jgi:hypothetical protein
MDQVAKGGTICTPLGKSPLGFGCLRGQVAGALAIIVSEIFD